MGAGPQLALERYAAITALIDGGEARDAVVERAGLATGEWQDAQLAWLTRLACEAHRDKRVLLDTFNELLVRYLHLVEQGEYERLWPVALGQQSEPEVVSALVSTGQGTSTGPASLPTLAATQDSSPQDGSSAAALPFGSAAAQPPPPASMGSGAAPYPASVRTPGPISVQLAPPSSRGPHEQTLDADGDGGGSPALPFQSAPGSVRQPTSQRSGGLPFVAASPQPAPPAPQPAPPAPQPAPPAPQPAPPVAKRSRTEPPPVGSGGALPFEAAPPSSPLQDPNNSTLDVPDRGGVRGTVGVDGLDLSAALPFQGSPPPADTALPFGGASKKAPAASNASAALPFQAPAKPSGALPFRAAAAAAPEVIAETIEQGPAQAEPARDPLTGTMLADFDGGMLTAEPTLTLEQFASITAEIRSSPEDQREAIRRRYGFDQAAHEREQLAWAGKLMSDPELNKRYAAKLREYRDYLARRGGAG